MRIVYAFADHPGEGSCSDWLCRFPANALYKAGYDVSLIHVSQFVEKPPDADIIVVERILWNGVDSVRFDHLPDGPTKAGLMYWADMKVLDSISDCQANGAKVIAVFDDHFEAYPDTHEQFRSRWLEGIFDGNYIGFVPIEQFKEGLGLVDAVMVPSKFLAQHYGKYASRMYRIHNRPNLSLFPIMQNDRAPRRLVVGWAGTSQHETSWRDSGIFYALDSLRDKIVLVGHFPDTIKVMLDKYRIPHQHGAWVEYTRFPQVVAAYDVGICPLAGEFDKGRSWIKWLECSLMGKPVIAQDHAGVYDECVGGFIVSDPMDWIESLRRLMDDDTYYRMSLDGLAWSWQQGWDGNLREITDIFEEVLGD
ncbi:MAG: glycosyltransferase family 4 protein [Deltaproteobacteria bacterium]|nr:glycosyltransferase family 4 protein [Deltaproteobacteria bacterium]